MFRTLIYPSSGTCDFVDEALVLQPAKRRPPNISRSKNSNTQRTENKTTDVVIHQQSRGLLKMDILMSETCWAHNKWNKITSDIKLVFHSSNKVTFWPAKRLSDSYVGLLHSIILIHSKHFLCGHRSIISQDRLPAVRKQIHTCTQIAVSITHCARTEVNTHPSLASRR